MGDREKKIFLFFLFIFFGFCALFAAEKIADPDFWWHLKTGEWIWQHKAIPHTDPFSYTFQGAEWINYEWFFHVLIYPLYRLVGFGGLIVFVIISVLLTFLILFFACREVDGGKRWLTITILFVALLVARGRFAVRPQIISSLLLAFYLYLLILHQKERITTRQLIFFLLPAHILWVNVHGSFLLGIFLVGAYALGTVVPLALRHHRDLTPVFKDKKLQGLLLACLLLCIASLVNPYTYRIFYIPLKTAGSEALQGITEWVPVDIKFLGVFAIEYTMWFRILFLIGAISFLIRLDNLKKVENVAIFALFSYMAFKHIRFSGDFAIVAAPIIVNNLVKFQWRVKEWRWLYLLLPLFFIISFSVNDVRDSIKEERLGLGVWRNYPVTTVNFLKEHGIKGKIFNAYGYGGYIIWHLWPDIPVFIDGRTPTVYSEDFFWLHRQGLENEKVWKRLVDEYAIDIVLIDDRRDTGYRLFVRRLDDDPSWSLVAFDDVSVLYLKDKPQFKEIIKHFKLKYFRPGDVNLEYATSHGDKDYLRNLIQELRLIEEQYPNNFYICHSLGIAYLFLGEPAHLENAHAYLKRALAVESSKKFGHFNLGITLLRLKRYEEAIAEFKEAATVNLDAYYYMGICYYEKGDFRRTIKILTKYKKFLGDATTKETYAYLGLSYLKTFQLQKAVSCFLRAHFLSEPTIQICENLGIAYFGLKNYEKASQYFQEALNLSPNDIKILYNLGVCYENLGRSKEALDFFRKLAGIPAQTNEERNLAEKAKRKLKSE